jgi:hypothetical protein
MLITLINASPMPTTMMPPDIARDEAPDPATGPRTAREGSASGIWPRSIMAMRSRCCISRTSERCRRAR